MVQLLQQLFETFGDNAVYILAAVAAILWNFLKALLKGKEEAAEPETPPAPAQRRPTPKPKAVPPRLPPSAQTAQAPRGRDGQRAHHLALAKQLGSRALALAEESRHEPANRRFVDPLVQWVAPEAQALAAALEAGQGPVPPKLTQALQLISRVHNEFESLVQQRRDPELRGLLGDADALAMACYGPVLAFAQAEGLPISSALPVTHLRGVDLAMWTGLAPTSIAPIYLPPQFFHRLEYWPALAHEIGHDFLVSVSALEPRLRAELGLGNERQGPLRPTPTGVPPRELRRILGGWFEELFCDAFGTLMCGPAYLVTMASLFGAKQDPRELLVVHFNPRRRQHDPHPPRHLRVWLTQWVLERAGLHAEAKRLWAAWQNRHQLDEDAVLLFPFDGLLLPVPMRHFQEELEPVLERLYAGPLDALNGFGLSGISGVDFGPHAQREAERVRDSLLAGVSPSVHDARSVMSGAVLAWERQPDRTAQLIQLARRAIPGVGTLESRPDVHVPQAAPKLAGMLDLSPSAMTEALLFHELVSRPPRPRSLRNR